MGIFKFITEHLPSLVPLIIIKKLIKSTMGYCKTRQIKFKIKVDEVYFFISRISPQAHMPTGKRYLKSGKRRAYLPSFVITNMG